MAGDLQFSVWAEKTNQTEFTQKVRAATSVHSYLPLFNLPAEKFSGTSQHIPKGDGNSEGCRKFRKVLISV